MPGKQEGSSAPEPTIVKIAGEEFELQPLVGLRSIHVVPRIMRVAAKLTYAAGKADIDLAELFRDGEFNIGALKVENLLAFDFIGETLVDNWADITQEILPALLNAKPQFLWNNGTFIEHLRALWTALTFHAPSLFGEDAWEALKKSASAPTPEGEEQTSSPETPSE